MVLGTLPMAFAADQTAGEMLKAAGFVAGDENGNLMEDNGLTRAELAVLVAELNGVKENAKTYAIAPEFKDVKADDWFGPYVAYAAKEGWFKGDDLGNFNPLAKVSDQTMATVMLRALGYEPAWETAVSEAKAMGLPVGAANAAEMTRGEAFSTMWGVVNTPKQGSDVALGVELGKIEPATPVVEELNATIDNAKAIAANLVEVEFTADVDAAAAGNVDAYSVVEKDDTTKSVAIVAVTVEGSAIVVVETEKLTSGKAYTVMVGDSSDNFSGLAKDSDAPKVDSVKGTDDGVVEVTFKDALVDKATAEDVANYSIDKEGTVVKAELNGDRDKVTLTVEGLTTPSSKKLTITNIASTDGVVLKSIVKPFGPKFDNVAPKIDDVYSSKKNNTEVIIDWTDSHGVNKATAEDVSNYSIEGLEILSAKAIYQDSDKDDYMKRVVLTTSEQTKSKNYKLKVLNMTDGSAAMNATTKVLEETFRGGTPDKDEPKIGSSSDVTLKNLTTIHVKFDEKNSLDLASALDVGNYTFKDEALDIVGIELEDADDNGNTYDVDKTGDGTKGGDNDDITVVLTVSQMEENVYYRLRVNNIADNYGNTMDKQVEKSIRLAKDGEVKTYSQISAVSSTTLEKVVVTFEHDVTKATANDPTNYVIDGGLGAVLKASRSSSDNSKVTLTVPKMEETKTYEITVNGVENYWGYAAEGVTKKFVSIKDGVDAERPEVEGVEYTNAGELRITFSEPMKKAGTLVLREKDTPANTITAVPVDELVEDDKIMVFDVSFVGDGGSDKIPSANVDETYEIASFAGVVDLAGNAVDYTAYGEEFTTASEVIQSTDRVVNDSLSQENGNVIHATFDRMVNDPNDTIVTAKIIKKDGKVSTDTMTFKADRHADDKQVIVLTAVSPTKFDDKTWELEFNFGAAAGYGTPRVFDILGRPVEDKAVTIDVDNDDEVGPSVVEVKVIDKRTITVEFDEKLSNKGSFSLKNLDDTKETFTVSATLKNEDTTGNVVELTLSKDLSSDDSYELSYGSSKPKDLAGNKVENDTETFEFVGTDKAADKDSVIAKVYSATTLTLVTTGDDFPGASNLTITADNSVAVDAAVATFAVGGTDVDEKDVVSKRYFSFLSKNAADKVITYTVSSSDATFKADHIFQTFTGLIEEDNVESVTTGAATAVVATDSMSFDGDNYIYVIIDSNDAIIATSADIDLNGDGDILDANETLTATNDITGNAAGQFLVDNAAFVGPQANVKLIAVPKNNTGITEFITETFTLVE